MPRESRPGETRVAATPKTVEQIVALGYAVFVESGAGARLELRRRGLRRAGADVIDGAVWNADVLLKINAPSDAEIARLRPGQVVVSLFSPALNPDLVDKLAARGVTALAMDAVPRISRAQSLDVLSSMANIGGYRAVVEAAHEFGSFFTGQVTAAGKVPPAKVLVVGAGVAGLAAIGTANSLGAIVRAFDARPEVGEQVESMGAEFLRIDIEEAGPSADGYAKETSADFDAKAAALYAEQAADVDIVITTALIPGRPAPRLLTEEMVASMKPGSVIVDMAASNGGNVAGSVADQKVVTEGGVTILGYTDLPGRLPTQASQLFGTNLVNLLKLLTPKKDGELTLDLDDVVQRGMTVVREGEVLWPPPPVQVSAAPAAAALPAAPKPVKEPRARSAGWASWPWAGRFPACGVGGAPAVPRPLHGVHVVGGHRVLRHRQRPPRPAHPVDVGDQRDQRHHRRRCVAAGRARQRRGLRAGVRRHPAREHQRLRWVPGDGPNARDVQARGAGAMTLPLTLVQGAYILAGLCFILALAGLSRHETARMGNRFGVIGMAIALVTTVLAATAGTSVTRPWPTLGTEGAGWFGLALILAAMGIGAAIGLDRAKKVEMTGMPELIAMLHSFVGLAAVLVGWNSSIEDTPYPVIHDVEVMVGVFIGAVTFTGSIVAFLKLSARIKSSPLMLPGRNWINLGAIAAFAVLTVVYVVIPHDVLARAVVVGG